MQYLTALLVLASTSLLPTVLAQNGDNNCPKNDQTDFYTSRGRHWQMRCRTEINAGYDLAINYETAYDYISCAQTCEDYQNHPRQEDCTAAVWNPDLKRCYLKSGSLHLSGSGSAQAIIPLDG